MLGAAHMPVAAAYALVFCALLAWPACVDARCRVIPNASVAALALWGLVGHALVALGVALPFLPSFTSCALTAIALVTVCLVFEAVWRAAHRGGHGMGMGDVKLMGAACLTLGVWVLPCLAVACLSAAVIETLRHNRTFAFGPYLCACFAVCSIYLVVSN